MAPAARRRGALDSKAPVPVTSCLRSQRSSDGAFALLSCRLRCVARSWLAGFGDGVGDMEARRIAAATRPSRHQPAKRLATANVVTIVAVETLVEETIPSKCRSRRALNGLGDTARDSSIPTWALRTLLVTGISAAILVFAASACGTPVSPRAIPITEGPGMPTFTPSDPQALDRLRDAIGSGDPAQVANCFTPDFRAELPQHPERNFVGADQVRANWTAIFHNSPHLTARILRSAVNGAEIWSEWEMTNDDKVGNPVVFTGPVILTTHNGKINWVRFYLDPVQPPK